MPTPVLTRQQQVLITIESTAGTYVTMTAGDGGMRTKAGATAELKYPTEPRNVARGTMTNMGSLTGSKGMGIALESEVNTPDTITDTPEHEKFLQACGFTKTDIRSIDIGAITSGPFTRNETITGGTSSGTGKVLQSTADGASLIRYKIISGSLQSGEEITGSSSGATADTSSDDASCGHSYAPVSNSQQTASIQFQKDGKDRKIAGAMGSLSALFEASKAGMFTFTLVGKKYSTADDALVTGISYNTEQPPILQGAGFSMNSVTDLVVHSISLDMGSNVPTRKDMAESTGFISAYITSRNPKATIVMETPPDATINLEDLWENGTKVPLLWNVGTVAGKIISVYADLAQIINITESDDEGISISTVECDLTGAAASAEDEVEIAMY